MLPIVNGLEADLGDNFVFEQRDVATDAGRATMQAYGLRGHPGYVLLAPDGKVLWSFAGAVTEEFLRRQLSRFPGQ